MHNVTRLLVSLAALIAAGAACAHPGVLPHVHPHPDFDLYVLLAAAVGAVCGALWGQTPFLSKTRKDADKGGKNGG